MAATPTPVVNGNVVYVSVVDSFAAQFVRD